MTFWSFGAASIGYILYSYLLGFNIEAMCNSFHWKGTTSSARGARISWDSVCTSKRSGGLGLRRVAEWNKVMGLKLIWLIFAEGGSLWVSWVRVNLIGTANFWELQPVSESSWIWKSICKLRPLARPMVICELGSGHTASFWHDNWTELGPLLDVIGERGPLISGLSVDATVREALVDGDWWISRSRSRNSIISFIKQCLPPPEAIWASEVDDRFLWKPGQKPPADHFSSFNTWHHLNPEGQHVDWHKQVWFKGRIPKHAFFTWVIVRNRILTRDRMLSWGLRVPSDCFLCNLHDETGQHLFFDCEYSFEVWSFFFLRAHLSPPCNFDLGVRWLKDHSKDSNLLIIFKLLFQACLYTLWKERNLRLHAATSRPAVTLIEEIKQVVKHRLLPLARDQSNSILASPTLIETWHRYFS